MAFQLTNGSVTFSFDADVTTGLKLSSFQRKNEGHVWVNSNANLWQATVFDAAGVVSTVLTTISPTAATYVPIAGSNSAVTLRWVGVPTVSTDKLDVTLSLEVRPGEDWLRCRISASWQGTPTRAALDGLKVMPLLLTPLNIGSDYAVYPSVFGILANDPTTNLGIDDRTYPNGRGYNMGVWGYYETLTSQGWMAWVEDWTTEFIRVRFGNSGGSLLFDWASPQQDNLTAGNPGRTLGSDYTYCLRPFAISQQHGWWDIGSHYRSRVIAGPAYFYQPPRAQRADLSAAERSFGIFLDFNVNDTTLAAGLPGITTALLASIRTNSGVPSDTTITGVIEAPSYGIAQINESIAGDLPAQVAAVYAASNAYLTIWKPAPLTLPGPSLWSKYRWFKQSIGGSNSDQLRWWTDNDLAPVARMSRQGTLSGGGADRRQQQQNGDYYRERTYPITGWNGGTLTATVTGAPSADFAGLAATFVATLIPAAGGSRLAQAVIASLGASSVTVTANFTDGTGAVATPLAGDSLAVHNLAAAGGDTGTGDCWYAAIHSQDHLRQLIANSTQGLFNFARVCGVYFDTYDGFMAFYLDYTITCYDAHTAWTKLDSNYVRHPYGGGSWHIAARRSYISLLKEAGRAAQRAIGNTASYWISCEDVSEAVHDLFDFCFHTTMSGDLWGPSGGGGTTKTIPLYSVAHPGVTRGRALNQEFSTALLKTGAPYNDPVLHAFQAYCLAADWPYGLNLPTLSLYEDNSTAFGDLWDAAQIGAVSATVRSIRDLWSQIALAETTWLKDYIRAGPFLPPAVVDYGVTAVTHGLSGSPYASQYTKYDTLYERDAFPRVTHGIWQSDATGFICVILSNWTDTAGDWSGTLAASLNLQGARVWRMDSAGHVMAIAPDFTFDGSVLTVRNVPAFSIGAVFFEVADTTAGSSQRITITRYKPYWDNP